MVVPKAVNNKQSWWKMRFIQSFVIKRKPNRILFFTCIIIFWLLYLWWNISFYSNLDILDMGGTSSSTSSNILLQHNNNKTKTSTDIFIDIPPPQSTAATAEITTKTTTTTISQQQISFRYEVCFVTSVYSSSVQNGDRPPDVTGFTTTSTTKTKEAVFGFFAFTNLPDLVAPGWQIVVYPLNQYRRYITQSRWPKFMVWQHPLMIGGGGGGSGGGGGNGSSGSSSTDNANTCRAIFYMDGFCGPKIKHIERYKQLAKNISQSYFGLFQNKHEIQNGPLYELDRIVSKKKDIAKNVEASKLWLKQHTDFSNDNCCTMYANHYIAYNPRNKYFQTAAKFFWDRYSLEEDSWRDQPLWSFVLYKFNITPTRLGTYEALFRDYFSRMGHSGHRYTDRADNINEKNNNANNSVNNTSAASTHGHDYASRKLQHPLSNSTTTFAADPPKQLCFVTASYSDNPDNADRPPGVRKLLETNPNFGRFIAFTNLPDLDAPGWTILTTNNLTSQYKRYITQSRWPKFMGWKHPYIQKYCQVVFYLDAYCRPKEKLASKFNLVAKQILQSTTSSGGLAQNLHEWGMGPIAEFERILEKKKDTLENVNASITWLQSQPDFNSSCTLYSNQYIAYDPQNIHFQNATTFFWDHFKLEQDSWRDQPLWCFVLDRFNLHPISDFGSFKSMYKEHKSRMAPGNHQYAH